MLLIKNIKLVIFKELLSIYLYITIKYVLLILKCIKLIFNENYKIALKIKV